MTSLLGVRRAVQPSCGRPKSPPSCTSLPRPSAAGPGPALLPFQRTLGGHRRYPEQAIRELAASLAREVAAS